MSEDAGERRIPRQLRHRLQRAVTLAQWWLTSPSPRRLRALLGLSGFVDPAWYLARYPDVAASGLDPLSHYLSSGAREGRDPGPLFSTWRYIRRYPDAAAVGVNPLLHYLEFGRAQGHETFPTALTDYGTWIAQYESLTEEDLTQLRQQAAALPRLPLISILMPIHQARRKHLRQAIESVLAQVYDRWELCIVDDASAPTSLQAMVSTLAEADARIRLVYRKKPGDPSLALNSALAIAKGEWVTTQGQHDLLAPGALLRVAEAINSSPDCELVYSDADMISASGLRYEPHFKPEFSPELFRAQNYLAPLTAHRAANIRAIGGWRAGFEGSEDYELMLRVSERIDASAIRHVPHVLYHQRAAVRRDAAAIAERASAAGGRALRDHVRRLKLPARVEKVPGLPYHLLRFVPPSPAPLVSIIIATRDHADLLGRAVGSILEKTNYAPFEILIVDNCSVETETQILLSQLARDPRIRVLPYPHAFNYSAINNFGVAAARGDILALVNNDVEVIAPDWLTEMVAWAAQEEIGCVGAKLYYPNDTIQHAGVILGLKGSVGHGHKKFPRGHPGYCGRVMLPQTVSAVTGACMVLRKQLYRDVGGLDEKALTVAFSDVDLCLKVKQAGYRNIWTPLAELYHHEGASRGQEDTPEKRARFAREALFMAEKWGEAIASDPFYSPHLAQDKEDFSIKR